MERMWAVTPGQMLSGLQDVRLGPVLFNLVLRVWTLAYIIQVLRGRTGDQFLFFPFFWCSVSELMTSFCCFTSMIHIFKKFLNFLFYYNYRCVEE